MGSQKNPREPVASGRDARVIFPLEFTADRWWLGSVLTAVSIAQKLPHFPCDLHGLLTHESAFLSLFLIFAPLLLSGFRLVVFLLLLLPPFPSNTLPGLSQGLVTRSFSSPSTPVVPFRCVARLPEPETLFSVSYVSWQTACRLRRRAVPSIVPK